MLSTALSTLFILLCAFTTGISSMVTARTHDHAVTSRGKPDASVVKRISNINLTTRDYYPGFNKTCSSWHFEVDQGETTISLVAKCSNGVTEVCSAISLEKCYYEAERWIYPIGKSPLNTYNDGNDSDDAPGFQDWFPNPCKLIKEVTYRERLTQFQGFFWKCDDLAPGHGNGPGEPSGYTRREQDLAMTISNEAGYLACPYAGTTGEDSDLCR